MCEIRFTENGFWSEAIDGKYGNRLFGARIRFDEEGWLWTKKNGKDSVWTKATAERSIEILFDRIKFLVVVLEEATESRK